MYKEVIAAIVGGVATIVAALIAGVFAAKKRDKKDANAQTALAGRNVIQTSGQGITQHISVHEPITPLTTQEENELLKKTYEIKDYANRILIDNERVLSPLFSKRPKRGKVRESLRKLFTEQQSRANFGEWEGYLTNLLSLDSYQDSKDLIEELLKLLRQLHDSLYSYKDSTESRLNNYETMKWYVWASSNDEDISLEQLRSIAIDYLEYLRSLVEEIGVIAGRLKSQQ